MPPIFIIAGAPAVGKSTTAHALAAQYSQSIHIPVDNIRDMVVSGLAYPGRDWSPELIRQLALARESAAQMAINYNKAGFAVTLDDFWDPNSYLLEYQLLFQQPNTHRILLFPNQQTAEERNKKRAGPGDASTYIADGIQAVYEHLLKEAASLARQGWLVINTTDKDLETTVKHILTQIE